MIRFRGARPPDRQRAVTSGGVRVAVHEWGDERAPPLLLTHGAGEFSRSFDVFAPLLSAGGWRVVAWDQRGHGDSQHAALSSWDADLRDALAVVDSLGCARLPVVGHSKGGTLMTMFADACPHRVSHVVNLDGFPSKEALERRFGTDPATLRLRELPAWLDHRRTHDVQRRAATVNELIERRRRVNPRLSNEWLRYLVGVGAEPITGRHWRWKLDPTHRGSALTPLRPEWGMLALSGLGMPYLAVLGLVAEETMSTGTTKAELEPYLPTGATVVEVAGSGHFVHIEQPEYVADAILDFLGGEPLGEPTPCDSAFVSAAEPAEQAKRELDAASGCTYPLKPLEDDSIARPPATLGASAAAGKEMR